MAANQKVRIVIRNPVWKGKWFFQRENDRGIQEYVDDVSKAALFTPELGVYARDKFRNLGNDVYLEDTQSNGPLFEREKNDEARYDDSRRVRRFVVFTNGLGLYAVPCNTPDGPRWTVRAVDVPAFAENNRHTSIESVFGNTAEEASQRATDSWGQQILFENPEAVAERERHQKQAEQQKLNSRFAGVRPGDRR